MISAIIPAKEESASIKYLVKKVNQFVDEVIVVTSSVDYATIDQLKGSNCLHVIEDQSGKGLALIAGAMRASGDILIFLDADLSHDPNDIQRLAQPLLDGQADLVSASRMLGGSSELFYTFPQFVRLSGSHIITLLLNHKFKVNLTDSQNGYRAIKRSVFQELELREIHTTIEQEMTAQVLRAGYRVIEVPSHEYARRFGFSKIKVFRDGWRYIFVLVTILLKPKPKNWKRSTPTVQKEKYNPTWYTDFNDKK